MGEHIVYDYFGTVIHIGDRAVMVKHYDHRAYFQQVTVEDIHEDRRGNSVKIIADDNSVSGWTKAKRLITEGNFKRQI